VSGRGCRIAVAHASYQIRIYIERPPSLTRGFIIFLNPFHSSGAIIEQKLFLLVTLESLRLCQGIYPSLDHCDHLQYSLFYEGC
jgi:hypothetical protein